MKNYVKPAVSFQFFNLVTGVSDGCNMEATSGQYSCPVQIPNWPGETVFATATGCTWETDNPLEFDVCYQGPSGITSVIGS